MDYLDLNNWSSDQQKNLLHFTEELAEHESLAKFGSAEDLDGAETAARGYVKRRAAGHHRTVGNQEDAEIRKSVKDFIRRKRVYRNDTPDNETPADTKDLKTTRPNYW